MTLAEKPPFVIFVTSIGSFAIELYWNEAPLACKNFAELARRKYYDGTVFHRIVPEFIIQGGDPTGTGRGGASIYGDKFADEISSLKHTGAGVVSMANSGPNTNGSQFFVTLAPAQNLDGKHTIFGRIAAGMKCIQKIGNINVDGNDKPLKPVKVVRAYPSDDSRFS